MEGVKAVKTAYLKEIAGVKHFCSEEKNAEDARAAGILARACANFAIDVEDEIYSENEVMCFNCRYRRWTHVGFSCYQGFPVKEF